MTNRIFTAINLALVAIGAYFAVALFYAVFSAGWDAGPGTAATGAAAGAPPENEPVPAAADYRVVVERNLFNAARQGGGDEKGRAAALDVDKLKQTELKLRLWGTVSGPDGQAAAAVIEDQKTREQLLYRPGDAVQNAVVKMILRQKVVLSVEGRDEVLAMEEPGAFARAPAPAGGRPEAPRAAAPGGEPVQQVSVPEEQIEKAMENLSEIMTQATFRPNIEDGRPAGIAITGIKPNAIFRRLRLRNGDVITGVNGQAIETVEDAMKVFGSLSTEGPLQVTVKRRGREQTLEYKVE
jgi:general secretion pathway protein C